MLPSGDHANAFHRHSQKSTHEINPTNPKFHRFSTFSSSTKQEDDWCQHSSWSIHTIKRLIHILNDDLCLCSCDENRSDKKIHDDIDESKVKAPNVFERAKEEFEAVIGAIHQRKSSRDESDKMEFKSEKAEDGKKKPNMMKKAKEEIKSLFQSKEKPHRHHHHHHKESHGRSDEIDENTPVDEVKAPSVFERAQEEIEAVIETIHPKKKVTDGSDLPSRSADSDSPVRSVLPEKEEKAGFGCSLGKGLEKICSPWGDNKKD
ncbi:unnamed protein product [Thlaspi arvense]|uniref:Uncharacterized protein n=1 Tax=Thlaspi arvense TaxID=13288 RepID=A0AAU9SQ20_THLAR|nr:unnamed protein product [Thlaspi arvense]